MTYTAFKPIAHAPRDLPGHREFALRAMLRNFGAVVGAVALLACGDSSHPKAPDPQWGAPCGDGVACAGGLSCIEDSRFPGGYCSQLCGDGSCPAGARCVDRYGGPLCLAECEADTDCRAEYLCWMATCRPPCAADAECGPEGHCGDGGHCSGAECHVDTDCGPDRRCMAGGCAEVVPDGGHGASPDGSPCRLPTDCDSRICLPPSLGGVCAADCTHRGGCSSSEACSPIPEDTDGDGAPDVVVSACVSANPTGEFLAGFCRRDEDCESRSCVRRQCTESCDEDTDCLPGQICVSASYPTVDGASFVGCGYAGRTGTLQVDDVDLGSMRVNTGLPSRRINFGLPNDTVSVTLMARHTAGDDLPLAFIDVWNPANDQLFDYTVLVSWVDQPIRWIPINTEEDISMLVPNSTPDRVTFLRGRYGFTVAGLSGMSGDSRSGTVQLSARVKRARGADVSSGALDLNIYLVGVGLTAAQARRNARLQGALAEMGRILGGASISLGAIDYIQITGADASRYAVIDSSDGSGSEMAGLLRLGSARMNDAVDLFLVRRITAGAGESGGIALGISGGIPGPPGLHGTMHSGVLVSFDAAVVGSGVNGQRTVAQIASHELSHYLGLFHNRERLAPCASGTGPTMSRPCAPFGGGDVLADTARGDGRNLMYFALGGADGRTYNIRLSSGQGYVLRRNAVIH